MVLRSDIARLVAPSLPRGGRLVGNTVVVGWDTTEHRIQLTQHSRAGVMDARFSRAVLTTDVEWCFVTRLVLPITHVEFAVTR